MRVCVIGSGYVGLVTAACFADSGNHVVGVDKDEAKVRTLSAGISPFFEPGLEELMRENMRAERLRFTTDLAGSVRDAQVIFIAVGTPPRPDGSADLSAVFGVAEAVARALPAPSVVVMKSTVPVGTGAQLQRIFAEHCRHPVAVVSNPEFLKEGAALDDFLKPDRVVIGGEDEAALDLVAELYKPFVLNNKPIIRMSRPAAEMCKYAANAYLATRISFINEIADICDRLGVDIDQVRRGMASDARIGFHFLYPGVGYGGSCFPKDVRALAATAKSAGASHDILDSVHERNELQRRRIVDKITARLGPNLRGRKLAVWGLSFKPKTDDVREAPAIAVIESLLAGGASVAVHDPRAAEAARSLLGERVTYAPDAYAALDGADALVILTEWNEYRSPDFDRIRATLAQPLIFDGRNIFDLATLARRGFEYHSIGRPPVPPPKS